MNINQKSLLMFSFVLLLGGCSGSSSEQAISLESAQNTMPKEAFCNLYTDSLNYCSGIYNFGSCKISYAFPNYYSISESDNTIYIWDIKNDISFEIQRCDNDFNFTSMCNSVEMNKEYSVTSQLFGSEFVEDIVQSEDLKEVETQSSSSEFGFVNQINYFFEYKENNVYIPLTSIYVNLGNEGMLVTASRLTSLADCPIDRIHSNMNEIYKSTKEVAEVQREAIDNYFSRLSDNGQSLYKEVINLFSYLYYGDVVSEGIETSLSDYGTFPFYISSILNESDINKLIMSKDIKASTVMIDDMYLTYFYQDKYFEAQSLDNIIAWYPADGEHNNQSFELIISDNYYDEDSIISEMLSIANSYVLNQNNSGFVNDAEKTLYNHIGVQKSDIDTFSISDELRECRQYQAYFMYDGENLKEAFNLPIIYYTVNYNGKMLLLRSQYNLSFIEKENLELFNKIDLEDFKDLKSVLLELSDSNYDSFIEKTHYMQSCSDSLNKAGLGLLRLLYAGSFNDLKGELSYEK